VGRDVTAPVGTAGGVVGGAQPMAKPINTLPVSSSPIETNKDQDALCIVTSSKSAGE
jgi:hypothetical protein